MWGGGGTYQAWADFLQRWGAAGAAGGDGGVGGGVGDGAGLPALVPTEFTGDSWERLTRRLTDAIDRRLRAWAESLTRGMAEARDEFGVGRALGNARLELRPIRALATHPALPRELSAGLVDLLDRQVRSVQRLLEEQVADARRRGADRRVVDARLRTIRDHDLTAAPAGDGWAAPATPTRRRVLLD